MPQGKTFVLQLDNPTEDDLRNLTELMSEWQDAVIQEMREKESIPAPSMEAAQEEIQFLIAKVQYLLDTLEQRTHFFGDDTLSPDYGVFTFPDGDTWYATGCGPMPQGDGDSRDLSKVS